jgi:hypothetical protein
MTMGLWITIQRFFRDAKVTEFYVKISKEEFQRNLAKIDAWHQDLQRKISQLPPQELTRERRRFF